MRLGGSLRRHRGGGGASTQGSAPGSARSRFFGGGSPAWGRLVLGAAGLALLGWGAGYLLATQVVYPAPPPPSDLVEVPDVRGLGLSPASDRLAQARLLLGPVDSLHHPRAAAGLVLGQSPLPGQLAEPGTEVRVTLSLPARARPVPDVRRVDGTQARQVLEAAGFVVSVDSVDSDIPWGRVVATRPPADAPMPVPSEVRISVSRGPALVAMPYLIGLAQAQALAVLDSVGLVAGLVDEVSAGSQDQGVVVGQEPAADTPMERGSAVRLAVGRRGG